MDAIFNRRSIRMYTEQEIPDHVVEKLLKAAMAAPSAGNEQPWQFVVIKDKDVLRAIPKFHPHARMLEKADCAIVVCGDLSLQVHDGYWVQDCSAATQNILIEAQFLGLGAVWLGVHPVASRVNALKSLLGLPESVIPLSIVVFGYPAEKKEPGNRFKQERVHQDRW